MANDLTKNPWLIDTASATNLTAMLMRLRRLHWRGGSTAGHTAVVADGAGAIVWQSNATGANYDKETVWASPGLDVTGLRVPTLASGVLEIEYA